jgi:hypothetical protein
MDFIGFNNFFKKTIAKYMITKIEKGFFLKKAKECN